MIRSETWVRLLLSLLFLYLLSLGTTFAFLGTFTPQFQFFTLFIAAVSFSLWVWRRHQSRWVWHHTPLDLVMPLWGIAFIVSTLANPETARRSMMGLWYAGMYMGVWYVLYDAVANRAIKHDALLDGLMFGGLVVIAIGCVEIAKASFDLSNFELPRPGGSIGNPNSLGTYLIVVLMLSIGRYLAVRDRLARIVVGLYGLSVFLLLFLTFSRGAWVGGAAAFGTLAFLVLYARGIISPHAARLWWQNQSSNRKAMAVGAGIVSGIVVVVVALLFIQSFGAEGRSADLRLTIYRKTVEIIKEEPLTGHGLFTYGQQLSRYQSQPPQYPHSHAHNLFLHVQAELGVFGTIALLATILAVGSAIIHNWRSVSPRQQMPLAGAIAATVGFGVHHLLDTTMMMPAIMLMGLLAIMLATIPQAPKPVTSSYWRGGSLVALMGLWIGLLGIGFWSVSVYLGYYDALFYVISDEENPDYRGGAEQIQRAIDADPNMAIYHQQQAYLYGMAAYDGDDEALDLAIAGFERFVELEPDYAPGWANLAALYWQDGQQELALDTIIQAKSLARSAWQLHFQAARYAESMGQNDLAREYYRGALHEKTRLWPAWDETPISQEIAAEFELTGKIALILALSDYETPLPAVEAERLWEESGLNVGGSVEETALRMILVLHSELDDDVIEGLYNQANNLAGDYEDDAWVHLGFAEVARSIGDRESAQEEIALARELIKPDIGRGDTVFGGNIAVFQFLRLAYPRQFLPQVYFPPESASLLHLLDAF